MGKDSFKRHKVYERIALYPVRKDGDEDDVQDLAGDRLDREKRAKEHKEVKGEELAKALGGEVHMPSWARLEEHESGDQFGTGSGDKEEAEALKIHEPWVAKARKRKMGQGARSSPYGAKKQASEMMRQRNMSAYVKTPQNKWDGRTPKVNGKLAEMAWNGQDFGFVQPRPFQELLDDITSWHKLHGKDYEIWPFHVQKCADYLW